MRRDRETEESVERCEVCTCDLRHLSWHRLSSLQLEAVRKFIKLNLICEIYKASAGSVSELSPSHQCLEHLMEVAAVASGGCYDL